MTAGLPADELPFMRRRDPPDIARPMGHDGAGWARPWESDPTAQSVEEQGFSPVLRRFIGYLTGVAEPFDVELASTSASADVALLRCELPSAGVPALELADRPPSPGEEVIVLGYPTGMQALLARAEPSFVEQLLGEGPLDFWELARGLAAGGHIAPLATVGVVGQVTPGSIVYDAETTHGGSGGPVLNLEGKVVAVNAAIVPEFGGSNLGVPAGEARELLRAERPDDPVEATSLPGELAPGAGARRRIPPSGRSSSPPRERSSLCGPTIPAR